MKKIFLSLLFVGILPQSILSAEQLQQELQQKVQLKRVQEQQKLLIQITELIDRTYAFSENSV